SRSGRAPRERAARGVGGGRRDPLSGSGGGRQRWDGGARRQPLRPLHALRGPRGVPLHLHGHDGHHGGRRRQGHARRAAGRRRALHRAPGGVARRRVVAVADAGLRRTPGSPRALPASRHRAPTRRVVPPPAVMLAVRDLAVRFGGVTALESVSFEVQPGSITSVIGPNGAGKTTAFNAITGYLRPTQGRITYDGVPLTGLRPSSIARRGIVRTFQKTSVFPALSVEDNVLTGLHLRGTAGFFTALAGRRRLVAEERALAAEAAAIIESAGPPPRRREPASALPYGQQRLVELAVALAARPRLLLLDEPGAGMTGAEKLVVAGLIRRVREQGVTVLLVEHDMR